MHKKLLLPLLLFICTPLFATEYQRKEEFLLNAFSGTVPKAKLLWMKKDIQQSATHILKHKPGFLRTRYWQTPEQTVWILDEIGKVKPITVAVIIKNQKIHLIKVLAFRESRGWEVKHAFFTDQFKNNELNTDLTLNRPIDGISGATLSVRALTKIAQLALFFNTQIQK